MNLKDFGAVTWFEFLVGVVVAMAIATPILLFVYVVGRAIFQALGVW